MTPKKCSYCDSYVNLNKAILSKKRFFCSMKHKRIFEKKHDTGLPVYACRQNFKPHYCLVCGDSLPTVKNIYTYYKTLSCKKKECRFDVAKRFREGNPYVRKDCTPPSRKTTSSALATITNGWNTVEMIMPKIQNRKTEYN